MAATPEPVSPVAQFLQDVQTFYCSSKWVRKDLTDMTINDCAACWQQLMILLTNRQCQWFYYYDSAEQYEQSARKIHRSFDDFVTDSVDSYWLAECDEYYQWMSSCIVDTSTGMIVVLDPIYVTNEKTGEVFEKNPAWDKTANTELSTVLWSMVPDAMAAFYMFYFEKQVNVIFKKLNYLAQESELSIDHLIQIKRDQEWLRELYIVAAHQTKQLSESQARELAYHYQRVCDVYYETFGALAERFGVAR